MSYISVCGFEIYGKISGACSDINNVFKTRKQMKKVVSLFSCFDSLVNGIRTFYIWHVGKLKVC